MTCERHGATDDGYCARCHDEAVRQSADEDVKADLGPEQARALRWASAHGGYVFGGSNVRSGCQLSIAGTACAAIVRRGWATARIGPDGGRMYELTEVGWAVAKGLR